MEEYKIDLRQFVSCDLSEPRRDEGNQLTTFSLRLHASEKKRIELLQARLGKKFSKIARPMLLKLLEDAERMMDETQQESA